MKAGNVPTAAVGPVIAQLVEERWPSRRRPEHEEWGYSILAEKVGCSRDAIDTIVKQSNEGVGFDLADKLLCALGRPDIWRGQLHDVYHSLKFPETTSEYIPDSFICGHSTGRDNLTRSGVNNGVQYFRCATCQRETRRRHRTRQQELADAA